MPTLGTKSQRLISEGLMTLSRLHFYDSFEKKIIQLHHRILMSLKYLLQSLMQRPREWEQLVEMAEDKIPDE